MKTLEKFRNLYILAKLSNFIQTEYLQFLSKFCTCVMLCAILYYLYNLRNLKDMHGGVLLWVKVVTTNGTNFNPPHYGYQLTQSVSYLWGVHSSKNNSEVRRSVYLCKVNKMISSKLCNVLMTCFCFFVLCRYFSSTSKEIFKTYVEIPRSL